jgi:hypothetical protein
MAPPSRGEVIIPFTNGLSDEAFSNKLRLSDGTYNFYPDGEGYLRNYPGKSDIFLRGPPDLPAYVSTPPSTSVPITRILSFRDNFGNEHLVFVRGAELCVKVGNGYEVLHKFGGMSFGDRVHPELFTHEGKLIILNRGDAPLMWDGVEGVHSLGVREAPGPLTGRVHPAPGMNEPVPEGFWEWAEVWWQQDRPSSNPAFQQSTDSDGSTTNIDSVYQVRGQYKDKYGNKGRPSPPSRSMYIPHATLEPINAFEMVDYLIVEWEPPFVEPHLTGFVLGRTLNLHPDDDQGGPRKINQYYVEQEFSNVTIGRFVCQVSDPQLLDNGSMDLDVLPPAQSYIGCSWKGRIFLSGHDDPCDWSYSDIGFFGQYRSYGRANDHVVKIIGMGDRIAIINRTGVQVAYQTNSGDIAILEQNSVHGSRYGRSFVEVAGGGVFGLWNDGFGFYDGNEFKLVDAPFFVKDIYVDDNHQIYAASMWRDVYIVSVRQGSSSEDNNFLLMFDMKNGQWYMVKDSLLDICIWQGEWIGCNATIYDLFKGDFDSESKIVINGFVPPGEDLNETRVLHGFRILMLPSSNKSVDVEIYGRDSDEGSVESRALLMNDGKKIGRYSAGSYWSKPGAKYADDHKWVGDRDIWVSPEMAKSSAGNQHDISLTFPAGHDLRLKAISFAVSSSRIGD